jgi:hypothetical protein
MLPSATATVPVGRGNSPDGVRKTSRFARMLATGVKPLEVFFNVKEERFPNFGRPVL